MAASATGESLLAGQVGAATHGVVEGVHRPLTLTAIVLSIPKEPPLALVSVEFGVWRSPEDEWLVRGAVVEALEVDPSRVILSLTHTHSGPNVYREDTAKPGSEFIAPYLISA